MRPAPFTSIRLNFLCPSVAGLDADIAESLCRPLPACMSSSPLQTPPMHTCGLWYVRQLASGQLFLPEGSEHTSDGWCTCRRPVASSVPCTADGGQVTPPRAPSLEAESIERLQTAYAEQPHAQVRFYT